LDEASRILQSPPYSFPAGRVGILLRKFDKDGNGKLDIEEFADFYAEAKATYNFLPARFDFCATTVHQATCIADSGIER